MRIAINTTFLSKIAWEANHPFFLNILKAVALQQTAHEFVFLLAEDNESIFFANTQIKKAIIGPMPKNALTLKWWYDVTLAGAVQKLKADVFICSDGCCTATKIPQVAMTMDSDFLNVKGFEKKPTIFYNKSFAQKSLHKAMLIITGTAFSKQEIKTLYKVQDEKIQVGGVVAHVSFQPIGWQERELVKDQYTGGKEFFLYRGALGQNEDIIVLLKAFSLFKKRQLSNMQLLLAPPEADLDKGFQQKLETYKYRSDVVIQKGMPLAELSKITAAAYAFIHPFAYGHDTLPLIECLQCGTPMIVSQRGVLPEIAADAALYADPALPENIAEEMKTIYKDENLRSSLISNGKERMEKFNVQNVANQLWDCIISSVKDK